ncbi:laforin-like [Sapajus apella]|uniref:Laforin-like n=1 Tax=Sapajus apella TaxID=9515 RepID=A0A6J3FJ74_SAPAP|nr:laforin-like [Sapajus apella]
MPLALSLGLSLPPRAEPFGRPAHGLVRPAPPAGVDWRRCGVAKAYWMLSGVTLEGGRARSGEGRPSRMVIGLAGVDRAGIGARRGESPRASRAQARGRRSPLGRRWGRFAEGRSRSAPTSSGGGGGGGGGEGKGGARRVWVAVERAAGGGWQWRD